MLVGCSSRRTEGHESNMLVGYASRKTGHESSFPNRPLPNNVYNYNDHLEEEFEDSSYESEELDSVSVCRMKKEFAPCFYQKGISGPVRSSADFDDGGQGKTFSVDLCEAYF